MTFGAPHGPLAPVYAAELLLRTRSTAINKSSGIGSCESYYINAEPMVTHAEPGSLG